ncbi:dihydropteroate synthase [Pectinatus haikarae]|uniref:Dihydropteroate synthase n=2 Tax=Pectinatus haikarae TaxID=349096 RepID=A0ABT9Y9W3_9FIRM|nr:dihydropteroate synthase [Pectinatus haikarae]MDQ0204285.1 dihydropteroate synthase [Pectinatus haikarae]
MKIIKINDKKDAEKILLDVDCTKEGTAMMAEKAVFRVVRIYKVKTKAANILKQTMLSKGGDAAVSRYCADLSKDYTDVVLMATLKQYRAAIPVLLAQPWGLKQIANELKTLLAL